MSDETSPWKLVKLYFDRTPAHFGERGIGMEETSERVRSDTLFSAWMSAYARLFGDRIETLLQQFLANPESLPFSLSSTFIYREFKHQQNQPETVYYLPRPLQFPPNYPLSDDLKFTKTYKALQFLPLKIWQRWYQGEGFTVEGDRSDRAELIAETEKTTSASTQLKDAGTFAYKEAFKFHKVPKIAVDRTTRATNLYYTGFVQFQWETQPSGLYFLLHFPKADSKLEADLQAALHFLGEEGIGGERSSGAGRFTVTWGNLPPEWENVVNYKTDGKTPQYQSLLSLLWDNSINSHFLHHASYELLQRSGWIASPSGQQRRRQVVSMFTEGSVFQADLAQLSGKLADVTPRDFVVQRNGQRIGHSIYRSGIALSLPVKVLETSGDDLGRE
jgi:CRISPR-associated protein Csm4